MMPDEFEPIAEFDSEQHRKFTAVEYLLHSFKKTGEVGVVMVGKNGQLLPANDLEVLCRQISSLVYIERPDN